MKYRTVGILGGMGPLATADLFKKIVLHTKASSDSEHLHIVIDNNTAIPDRTEYIMGRGESPVSELVKSALKLELMGAEVLVMPCNTAHFFYNEIKRYVKIDFINMIEETAVEIKKRGSSAAPVLLATEGTCKSGIYDTIFEKYRISIIKPEKSDQEIITSIIYNVKKGIFREKEADFADVLKRFKEKGGDSFILGCTELPVYFETLQIDEKYFDPTDILALRAVERAGKETV